MRPWQKDVGRRYVRVSKSARPDVEVWGSDRMELRGCEALDATERCRENTDGDGVEQDLFQKNNLQQNPRPPGFQCGWKKKITSFAWWVGNCCFIRVSRRGVGWGWGGVIGPTVDLK